MVAPDPEELGGAAAVSRCSKPPASVPRGAASREAREAPAAVETTSRSVQQTAGWSVVAAFCKHIRQKWLVSSSPSSPDVFRLLYFGSFFTNVRKNRLFLRRVIENGDALLSPARTYGSRPSPTRGALEARRTWSVAATPPRPVLQSPLPCAGGPSLLPLPSRRGPSRCFVCSARVEPSATTLPPRLVFLEGSPGAGLAQAGQDRGDVRRARSERLRDACRLS